MYVLPHPIGHCSFAQCHAVEIIWYPASFQAVSLLGHTTFIKVDSFLCLNWYCCDSVSSGLNYDGTNSCIVIFSLFGFLVY